MAKPNLFLGKRVEYRDSNGFPKLAFVTGTAATVQPDTGVPVPAEDEAHLFVVAPTGKTYHRESIKLGEGPGTFSAVAK